MLVNYFIKNKLKYSDIEDINSITLLIFAIYSSYNVCLLLLKGGLVS